MGRRKLTEEERKISVEKRKIYAREYAKDYYRNNPDKVNYLRNSGNIDDYKKYLLTACKTRAKASGVPFFLEPEDIDIPEYCPALGIKLSLTNSPENKDTSPSLDRFYPEKGYVKGNVRVISFRANRIKNDSTLEELESILKYLRENIPDRVRDYIII